MSSNKVVPAADIKQFRIDNKVNNSTSFPEIVSFHASRAKEVLNKLPKEQYLTDITQRQTIATAISLLQYADPKAIEKNKIDVTYLTTPLKDPTSPDATPKNILANQFAVAKAVLTIVASTKPADLPSWKSTQKTKPNENFTDKNENSKKPQNEGVQAVSRNEEFSNQITPPINPKTRAVNSEGAQTTKLSEDIKEPYIEVPEPETGYTQQLSYTGGTVPLGTRGTTSEKTSQSAYVAATPQVIAGSALIDRAIKESEINSRDILNDIERGVYGTDLKQQIIDNPNQTKAMVEAYTRQVEARQLALVHTDVARAHIDKFPELEEEIRRRDLMLSDLQEKGLYDPESPIPGDTQMGDFAPGYTIGIDAAHDPNSPFTQIPDEQFLQKATEIRTQYISDLTQNTPNLPNLSEVASRAKQFLGGGEGAAEQATISGISKITGKAVTGATTKLGTTAVTGTTKLLGAAGKLGKLAGIAGGPIGWIATLAPEVLNFLRDPGRALENLGKNLLKLGGVILGGALAIGTLMFASLLSLAIPIILTLLGIGLFVMFALFVINTGNVVIPSAPAIILERDAPNSANIQVTKTAAVDGRNNVTQIDNISGSTTISYTITVNADQTLTNIAYNNSYTISQNPQTAPSIIGSQLLPPAQISAGRNDSQSYDLVLDERYNDSLVCDTFTVSANVNGGTRQTSTASYCISIGDSPAIAGCSGPAPTTVPTAVGVLYSEDRNYAFPVAPYAGTWEGTENGACVHWDNNRSTDIFPAGVVSDRSNPVYATTVAYTNGVIREVNANPPDATGGKNLFLLGDDGGWYYYAHHCHIFVNEGQRVTAGQVLGLTDRTGSAGRPGSPEHLHFAINRRLGGNFISGDGDTCPATDFNRTIQGYNRCELTSQQCPGSNAIPVR